TDDAAVLSPPPGEDLVLTTDMLAADVHFFADDPPAAIAAKALRVNLSDLASKGATPRGYLLGLGLPGDWTEDWLKSFALGLRADQAAFDVVLLGGDTIRSSGKLILSITAIGSLPPGTAVRRSGAKPGDAIIVTGTIGDAALGLKLRLDGGLAKRLGLAAADEDVLLDRYLLPRPRVRAAAAVRAHAHAAMDVSDGIAADLGHLCRASQLGAEVDVDAVPLSAAARHCVARDPALLAVCLAGGDDYEILAAVPEDRVEAYLAALAAADIAAARIGTMTAQAGAPRFLKDGAPLGGLPVGGFAHF